MKLKNVLIVVKDIEKSKQFYHDLFGLNVVLDNDSNRRSGASGRKDLEEFSWKRDYSPKQFLRTVF